jgi:hypothetical protein
VTRRYLLDTGPAFDFLFRRRTIHNCTVVSGDGDLSAVPGLRVEDWAS